MQLGTRWSVGHQPPQLPSPVLEAIATVEADIASIDTSAWRWTLTWLESKPVVQLDDGTTIRFDAASNAVIVSAE